MWFITKPLRKCSQYPYKKLPCVFLIFFTLWRKLRFLLLKYSLDYIIVQITSEIITVFLFFSGGALIFLIQRSKYQSYKIFNTKTVGINPRDILMRTPTRTKTWSCNQP